METTHRVQTHSPSAAILDLSERMFEGFRCHEADFCVFRPYAAVPMITRVCDQHHPKRVIRKFLAASMAVFEQKYEGHHTKRIERAGFIGRLSTRTAHCSAGPLKAGPGLPAASFRR